MIAAATIATLLIVIVIAAREWVAPHEGAGAAGIGAGSATADLYSNATYKALKGWTVVVVDPDGPVYQQLLWVVHNAGLRVRVVRYATLNALRNLPLLRRG